MSRYQKGNTNLDFTEARYSEWQWHQLGHMQVCTSLRTDNFASIPPLSFFTGRMPFLPPNQQRQSTEGSRTHSLDDNRQVTVATSSRNKRRAVDRRSGHVHRAAADQTQLVVLPLQRAPEDVRPALGVSASATSSSPESATSSPSQSTWI